MLKKKLIKTLSIFSLMVLIIPQVNLVPALAGEVGIAVSPSKLYDQQIDVGETRQFTFSAKNSSSLVEGASDLHVDLKASIFNEFGEEITNAGVVTLGKSSMDLPFGKADSVVATVSIPEGFENGSYVIYTDFIFKSVNVNSPILQTNVISVPLYLYVGDRSKFEAMDLDFEIIENHLDYEKTTVLKETLSSFVSCINPLKIKDVYKGIITRPAYLFTKDGKEFLDINSNITTKLKNVVTHKERGLSDWKYVYCPKEDKSSTVGSIAASGNQLALSLENGSSVIIDCSTGNLENVEKQITSIRKANPNSTLNDLLENVEVPINKTYYKKLPVLVSTIKSLSPIPITITGKFTNTRNYSNLLYSAEVFSPTILPNEVGEFKNNISDKDLAKGDYLIEGKFNVRAKSHDLVHSFEVGNLRNQILLPLTLLLIVTYSISFLVIRLIIRKFRKRSIIKETSEESMSCDDSLNIEN